MKESPRKIIRNTLGNSASFAYAFIANLFLLPYIVHSLGPTVYGGIWAILGALTAYLGLLDLGTSTAFVKYIAEYHTKDDHDALVEVVNTGLGIYAMIAVVLLSVTFAFDRWILEIIGERPEIMDDARFVLRVGMITFVLANAAAPITSILPGIQRMDLGAYIAMSAQTLSIVGTIVALHGGFGVRGLIVNNLVVVIFTVIVFGILSFRELPYLQIRPRFFRRERIRQLIRYGLNLQVGRLGDLVVFQTDRLFNLRFFGNVAAAFYDLGARVNGAARSLLLLLISGLIPAVAEIEAQADRERLIVLYLRGSRYVAVASTFVFVFVAAFAPLIMIAWMGETYESSAMIVRILAVGYFANIVTGVASAMVAGLGRTEFSRRFGLVVIGVNIVAALTGAALFGSVGIALGTSCSLVLGAIYFLAQFHRHMEVPTGRIFEVLSKPLAIGVVAAAFTIAVRQLLPLTTATRLDVVIFLGALFVVYALVFGITVFWWNVFDAYDIDLMRTLMRKFVSTVQTKKV
ncbi:MAG TPA: oligosaccharide flippase family protein [Bacteroidota bacterium]|nr:oligosaccharide flippase family protein [Bacteroidota bacterium]